MPSLSGEVCLMDERDKLLQERDISFLIFCVPTGDSGVEDRCSERSVPYFSSTGSTFGGLSLFIGLTTLTGLSPCFKLMSLVSSTLCLLTLTGIGSDIIILLWFGLDELQVDATGGTDAFFFSYT